MYFSNSISDDEAVVYESIEDGEVFYDEVSVPNKRRSGKPVHKTLDKDELIVDNEMYEGKQTRNMSGPKPKVMSTYTEVRDVKGGAHDPGDDHYAVIANEEEEEEEGYAQVHRESLISEGDSHSLVSQDSLYSDDRRQHKDLKRLCEPSPRLAPLLRRTRLAELEASSSLSSGCSDSTTTGVEGEQETETETEEGGDVDEYGDYAVVGPGVVRLSSSTSPTDVSPADTPPVPQRHYRVPKDANIDLDFNFPEIPELPHPRRELAWDTPFDQIRIFIANNRGPTEFYTAQKIGERYGEGILALKAFLGTLESPPAEEPQVSHTEAADHARQEDRENGNHGLEPLPGCEEMEITCL